MDILSPTKKGLITSAVMISASLISYYILKNPIVSNFQLLIYALYSLGIIWSLVSVSKNDAALKKFNNYFSIGFKTFVVVTFLMAIYTFIFFTFHTEYRDDKIAENSRLIIAQGNHLPAEIEENAKKFKNIFLPVMVFSSVLIYLTIGLLITVIASAFLTQKHNLVANK